MREKSDKHNELKRLFTILAHEATLDILSLLKARGEKSVGQIADRLELSYKVTSKHLLILSENGILGRRYDGPFVMYKIRTDLSNPASTIINELL